MEKTSELCQNDYLRINGEARVSLMFFSCCLETSGFSVNVKRDSASGGNISQSSTTQLDLIYIFLSISLLEWKRGDVSITRVLERVISFVCMFFLSFFFLQWTTFTSHCRVRYVTIVSARRWLCRRRWLSRSPIDYTAGRVTLWPSRN